MFSQSFLIALILGPSPEPNVDRAANEIVDSRADASQRQRILALIEAHYGDRKIEELLAAIIGIGQAAAAAPGSIESLDRQTRVIQDVTWALGELYDQTDDWGYLEFGLELLSQYLVSLPAGATNLKESVGRSIETIRNWLESDDEFAAFRELVANGTEKYRKGDYSAAIEHWTDALRSVPDSPKWTKYRMEVVSRLASAHMDRYFVESDAHDLKSAQRFYLSYRKNLDPADTQALSAINSQLWQISRFMVAEQELWDREVRRFPYKRNTFTGGRGKDLKVMNTPQTLDYMGYSGHARRYRLYTEHIVVSATLASMSGLGGTIAVAMRGSDGVRPYLSPLGASLLVLGGVGVIFSVRAAVLRHKQIDVDFLVQQHNEKLETERDRALKEVLLSAVPLAGGAALVARASF